MTADAMITGSRWMWSPHANGYTGLADVPEPCTIVRESALIMTPTRYHPHPEPFDFVVQLDDGAKVYARRRGLSPLASHPPEGTR